MSSNSEGFEADGPMNNSQSSHDSKGDEESINLAYEPAIIKGKGGERLWHAEATKECATICKLQLKVIALY
jgi:hypothetical protein